MRIQNQSQSMNVISNSVEINDNKQQKLEGEKLTSEEYVLSNEKIHKAVDSLNEIFEINNRNLKFVFHDGLQEYYVQLVDATTDEVIKEIPSKKLLDTFYEMQKLVGMIIDEKI
ncbi:flagellar protein FlaG [Lysinibacillus composti]|uniref:Flagellar biosynthesis protein FlaG n=1 Tax=Lysinibacillus composti TaxID=720633 RepID=A0A3N9UH60_9BACI|nr:flagellar protein FlaG [Lysinibacillus composti]MBM7607965.1 flagellar protein FlaG [Lysinibacillus composti]RQW75427.1 flagellar biosynthesis protein FlaG [Lysinibacillus composti]